MEEETNQKDKKLVKGNANILQYISFTLLVFSAITLSYIYFEMKTDGGICLKEPIEFGIRGLEKANNAVITCSCVMDKINSPTLIVTRDNSTINQGYTENPQNNYDTFNWSEINLTK